MQRTQHAAAIRRIRPDHHDFRLGVANLYDLGRQIGRIGVVNLVGYDLDAARLKGTLDRAAAVETIGQRVVDDRRLLEALLGNKAGDRFGILAIGRTEPEVKRRRGVGELIRRRREREIRQLQFIGDGDGRGNGDRRVTAD